MAKRNLLLAIILSLLFTLIIGIGLDFPKGRNLAQNNSDPRVVNGLALALPASARQLVVSLAR